MARSDRIELREDGLLDLHTLGHGLDDEIDASEIVVIRRPGYAAERLLELAIGVLLADLLLRDEAPKLALRDLSRLLETLVDELLLHVLHEDRDAGRPDDLGDL